jgi:hypothetical protein
MSMSKSKSVSKRPKKYSECRKKPQAECIKLEKCVYTNGLTHKYCRLKNNKRGEVANETSPKKVKRTLKLKPKDQDTKEQDLDAKERDTKERDTKSRDTKDQVQDTKSRDTKARGVIQRFMNKTKHRRKALFLRAVCLDSGVCLAFGAYEKEIKKHFSGFANFEYATAPIKRIGSPSANGFINEIQYDHRGYKAYAVLKSAMRPGSDNLMYEYVVGQYVNKFNKRFPCFLETYGYYIYNNDIKINDKMVWAFLKNTKITSTMDTIKKGLVLQKTTDYAKACKQSKYLAILIQHLKGIQSIKHMVRNAHFVTHELLNVLFQIYVPLSMVANTFTHYDLHHENVNLYEPAKDSYIQFHYHTGGNNVVSFKSKYIAKIIDYGRSYFKDEESGEDSKKIYTDLCKEKKCNPECGYNTGFSWLTQHPDVSVSYWITSQTRNKSHDLRLLNDLKGDLTRYNTETNLTAGVKAIMQKLKYDTMYGTPEMDNNGYPNTVNNIVDAATMLFQYIKEENQVQLNENEYLGKTKLGDLHIYCGQDDRRPMQFIKA